MVRMTKTKTKQASEQLVVRETKTKNECPRKLIVSSFGVAGRVSWVSQKEAIQFLDWKKDQAGLGYIQSSNYTKK